MATNGDNRRMNNCRKCGTELIIGKNWSDGRARHRHKICNKCSAFFQHEYRLGRYIPKNPRIQIANPNFVAEFKITPQKIKQWLNQSHL
jgi:ribosomal protein L40E